MKSMFRPLPLLLVAAFGACNGETTPSGPPTAPASTDAQRFVLAADPGAAEPVKAAKGAGARDKVVVTGRVADVVAGLAAFRIMDTAIPYCGEVNPEDHCKTPWDYCCESATTRTDNSLLVELRGQDGKPIATPSLPDLRLLDVVKVTGKLAADGHGNLTLLADGLFRTARPKVPDDLEWPR